MLAIGIPLCDASDRSSRDLGERRRDECRGGAIFSPGRRGVDSLTSKVEQYGSLLNNYWNEGARLLFWLASVQHRIFFFQRLCWTGIVHMRVFNSRVLMGGWYVKSLYTTYL